MVRILRGSINTTHLHLTSKNTRKRPLFLLKKTKSGDCSTGEPNAPSTDAVSSPEWWTRADPPTWELPRTMHHTEASLPSRNMENRSREHSIGADRICPWAESLPLIWGGVLQGVERGQGAPPVWAPPLRRKLPEWGRCFPNTVQLHRWRKWGSEMLNNLAKITPLLCGRPRNQGPVEHQVHLCPLHSASCYTLNCFVQFYYEDFNHMPPWAHRDTASRALLQHIFSGKN